MGEYFGLAAVFGIVIASIIGLRIFFTLWGPIDRRINPPKPALMPIDPFEMLRDRRVDVRLKSGEIIENVRFEGSLVPDDDEDDQDFEPKPLLTFRDSRDRGYFIRVTEIQYMMETTLAVAQTDLAA